MGSFIIMAIVGGIMYIVISNQEKTQKQKVADKKLFESAFAIEPRSDTEQNTQGAADISFFETAFVNEYRDSGLKIKAVPHKPTKNQKYSNGGVSYFFLFLLWISSGLSFLYALYSILANIIHFNILIAVGWTLAAFVAFLFTTVSSEWMDQVK